MRVICVTYPITTSTSSGNGNWYVSISNTGVFSITFSLTHSFYITHSLTLFAWLEQFAPRTCPMQLQLLLVQHFNDGKLHFPPRARNFSRTLPKIQFRLYAHYWKVLLAWENRLLRFVCQIFPFYICSVFFVVFPCCSDHCGRGSANCAILNYFHVFSALNYGKETSTTRRVPQLQPGSGFSIFALFGHCCSPLFHLARSPSLSRSRCRTSVLHFICFALWTLWVELRVCR